MRISDWISDVCSSDLRPRRADLTKATLDHSTPTLPAEADGRLPYVSADAEAQVAALRRNCARHGIELFDYDSAHRGIVHVIGPELGLTHPGMTLLCCDIHTPTPASFASLAFCLCPTHFALVLATPFLLHLTPNPLSITFSFLLRPPFPPYALFLPLFFTLLFLSF